MGNFVGEKWPSSSFNVAPQLRRRYDAFLASKGLTYTKLINGVMLALLTGDIKIDVIPYGEQRVMQGVFTELKDLINITLRDKDGNILNPTKEIEIEEE